MNENNIYLVEPDIKELKERGLDTISILNVFEMYRGFPEEDKLFMEASHAPIKSKEKRDIKFKGIGTCEIVIHKSGEGSNIPHIHIIGKEKNFNCALMLEHSAFFNHGVHKDILTGKKRIDDLVAYLHQKLSDGRIVWEFFVDSWNEQFPNAKIDKKKGIPNYANGILTYEEFKEKEKKADKNG